MFYTISELYKLGGKLRIVQNELIQVIVRNEALNNLVSVILQKSVK